MGERFIPEGAVGGRKKSERNWLLNKYTALLAGVITVLGFKLGLDDSQKEDLQKEVMSDLKDSNEELPENMAEAERVLKARATQVAEDIVNDMNIAKARLEEAAGESGLDKEVVDSPEKDESEAPRHFVSADDDRENERYWSLEKCVKEWGQITNVEVEVDDDQMTKTCYNFKNGQRLCKITDKTLPENPPVTREKLNKIGEYFGQKCPAAKVIEMDGDGRRFFLDPGGEVTVGEDGSFSLNGRSFYQGGDNLTLDELGNLAILNTEIEQLENESKGSVEVDESGVSTETREQFEARSEEFMKNLKALKAGYFSRFGR